MSSCLGSKARTRRTKELHLEGCVMFFFIFFEDFFFGGGRCHLCLNRTWHGAEEDGKGHANVGEKWMMISLDFVQVMFLYMVYLGKWALSKMSFP